MAASMFHAFNLTPGSGNPPYLRHEARVQRLALRVQPRVGGLCFIQLCARGFRILSAGSS
jgi:hypothetical protein